MIELGDYKLKNYEVNMFYSFPLFRCILQLFMFYFFYPFCAVQFISHMLQLLSVSSKIILLQTAGVAIDLLEEYLSYGKYIHNFLVAFLHQMISSGQHFVDKTKSQCNVLSIKTNA